MKKKVPRPRTDEQAEAFLAQDLSKLDFSQFKTARFEFERKDEQINIRVPKALLAAVKARAKARGIPSSSPASGSPAKSQYPYPRARRCSRSRLPTSSSSERA
jgi:predicted DNA binding CopG/RHH family protein